MNGVQQRLSGLLRDVPDHPVRGVVFKDITPILADHGALTAAVEAMAAQVPDGVEVICGVEARGFLLGAPLALELGVGFVPIRKAGKLPGPTHLTEYDLEYGSARIEVHTDAFENVRRTVVVDDVLATGGTAVAACRLAEQAGAEVLGVQFMLEIGFLGGRTALAGRNVSSLLTL